MENLTSRTIRSGTAETPLFSWNEACFLIRRILIIFFMLLLAGIARSQCNVYDGQGNSVNNPVWVSCSGGAYTLYVQSPNNFGYTIINWGDGTANTVVNSIIPPAYVSHTYAAAIANYTVTITDTTNNCVATGLVVMEKPVNASIQIPIGGVTQTCAPNDLIFLNSSTDVSQNTTFTWDFGDGSPILTFGSANAGETITHTYLQGTVDCVTEVILTAENYCSFGNPTEASFNPIQIYDLDDAQITASNVLLCYPDTVVHFANTTAKNCVPQGNTAQRFEYWNFGNYWGTGQDSIFEWTPFDPPAKPGYDIAYPGIGVHTVMMADSNMCGRDTAFITIQIVEAPIAGLTASADSACTGTPITFTNTSTGGNQTLINYGDGGGFLAIGATSSHSYGTAGNYTVTLVTNIVGGTQSCDDTVTIDVEVLPSPTASASLSPASGCDSLQAVFINSSFGGSIYYWDFGNGDTSTLQNPPPIMYTNEGPTQVILVVTSNNGCSASDTAIIEVFDTPLVNFGLQNFCEDALASFVDSTTVGYGGPVNSWLWSFGDTANTTSTLQNPSFIYVDSGTYTITLIAATAYCQDSVSQTIVVEAKPNAGFTPSDTVACSPFTVAFTNTSVGAVSYAWSFGDGNTSAAVSPSHTFIHSALTDTTFVVRMIAQSAFGCVDTVYDTITVLGNPAASFSSDAVLDCAPLEVNFSDSSAGAVSWLWDFGDFTGSTLQNPSKIFENQTLFITNYTVKLFVTAPNGCVDSVEQTITVYPEPLFNFQIVPDSGCSPLVVQFPVAVGAVLYNWDFGDGNTATGPNPPHTYYNNTTNSQIFTAQLIATSPFGCLDTVQGDVKVFPNPTASITPLTQAGCEPYTASFVNASTGGTTYTWDYDNGQTQTTNNISVSSTYANGTNDTLFFQPMLIATSNDGCIDTAYSEVAVYRRIDASFSVPSPACHPYNANFTDQSVNVVNWSWDFDNGQFSTQQNPNLFFLNTSNTADTFDVNLEVQNLEQCADDTTVQLVVFPKPSAIYTINNTPACHEEEVQFTNSSTQNAINQWRFGNGLPYIDNDPVIDTSVLNFTTNPITFSIQLIVENDYGCTDTTEQSMQVFPWVDAKFASIDEGCSPFDVEFTNLSSGGNLYEWQFGDGQVSFLDEPEHTFVNNDTMDVIYTVVLSVTSPYGCTDQDSFDILVHPTPKPQFTVNPAAQTYPNATVSYTNLTNDGPWSYEWKFGDGTDTVGENPTDHLYPTWGAYRVTLTASSPYCEDTISRIVLIEPPLPVAEFDTLVDECAPIAIQFFSKSEYAETFLWEFGDGATSTAENPLYTYQFPGVYTVKLTVLGPGGQIDSKEILNAIRVNPEPLANFVHTPDEVNIPLEPVTFINYSQYADGYLWNFGDGNTSEDVSPQHQYGESGEFYPWLVAYTNLGCSDTAYSEVPVRAIETGVLEVPNAFTPNPNGPSDEMYDPRAFDNEIFFPIFSGVSSSNFTLSIFNRWGELLFETHDVNQGWNGYYRNAMCVQDVYVWKVRGEYANGERFTKVGDVTLIQ